MHDDFLTNREYQYMVGIQKFYYFSIGLAIKELLNSTCLENELSFFEKKSKYL